MGLLAGGGAGAMAGLFGAGQAAGGGSSGSDFNPFSSDFDLNPFPNDSPLSGLFDPLGMWSGKAPSFDYKNPGSQDYHALNPYVAANIDYLIGKQTEFDKFSQDFTDPARYASRMTEYGQRAETSAMNKYASLGLAGSSAAIGGASEAHRQSDMAWTDRQLSDQATIRQIQASLTGQITSDIMNVQNQWGNYQDKELELFKDEQNRIADQKGKAFSMIGTVLGGVFGGPMGAQAGGAAGGALTPAKYDTSGSGNGGAYASYGNNAAAVPMQGGYGYGGQEMGYMNSSANGGANYGSSLYGTGYAPGYF